MESAPNKSDALHDTALLAGGCFWCLEAIFASINGVREVKSGYCGGTWPDPDYHTVCRGQTGHAETVRIVFDPQIISYATLLEIFFKIHDPTTPNRQGHDIGTQYRSAIFYLDECQQFMAQEAVRKLTNDPCFSQPIVTEIVPAGPFYCAEYEHQGYFWQNHQAPYCQAVISPKLALFQQQYSTLLRN